MGQGSGIRLQQHILLSALLLSESETREAKKSTWNVAQLCQREHNLSRVSWLLNNGRRHHFWSCSVAKAQTVNQSRKIQLLNSVNNLSILYT